MKRLFLLAVLALPLSAQSTFDFSLLDKLGANAKNKTKITISPEMMKLASGMLGNDKETESVKKLVANVNTMTVRSYEYAEKGQYNDADLAPLRDYLKRQKWSQMVDSEEDGEHSEIYLQPQGPGKVGGMAIIAAEKKEVTVVFISGSLGIDDLSKLSGQMGIPDIKLDHSGKGKKEE